KLFGAQRRHSFALETEASPRLAAFRHLHAAVVAVDSRHLDLAAERGENHGDRHPAMQIRAFTLEECMRADGEKNVEVAGWSAAHARLAFARKPDTGAVLDPWGHIYLERALARHSPRAGTGGTRVVDHLTATQAGWTGPLQGKKSLGVTDASLTAASRTRFGSRAGLGTRP